MSKSKVTWNKIWIWTLSFKRKPSRSICPAYWVILLSVILSSKESLNFEHGSLLSSCFVIRNSKCRFVFSMSLPRFLYYFFRLDNEVLFRMIIYIYLVWNNHFRNFFFIPGAFAWLNWQPCVKKIPRLEASLCYLLKFYSIGNLSVSIYLGSEYIFLKFECTLLCIRLFARK